MSLILQHPPVRPDVRRNDWAKLQTKLEAEIPPIPELHNGQDIDTCVENFSGDNLGALAATTPKRLTDGDPRPQIPAGIQDETRLKNRLRTRWQVTRDPVLRSEVNLHQTLVSRRLNEWRNDHWSKTRSKFPGPNGIPIRDLKYFPMRAVILRVHIFNAILCTHHFTPVWKHARVISILKPGKDPAQPSSYRPIGVLDTIGKLFEKFLLTRILHQVFQCGLLRDEQFGFRPGHSTSLQLARLVERITRRG
jgi:hypothetical protein